MRRRKEEAYAPQVDQKDSSHRAPFRGRCTDLSSGLNIERLRVNTSQSFRGMLGFSNFDVLTQPLHSRLSPEWHGLTNSERCNQVHS